jgi:predicted flap endonuclease-1-like 5' DNA nuclease
MTLAATPAEAMDDLAEIVKLNEEVTELQVVSDDKAKEAKAAKNRLENAQRDLNKFIADLSADRPLFDRPKPTAAEAADHANADTPAGPTPPPQADADAWRRETIASLGNFGLHPKIIEKINEAGILTIGALAEWTAAGNRLIDIDGIGDGKAAKIDDALEKFWAARSNGILAATFATDAPTPREPLAIAGPEDDIPRTHVVEDDVIDVDFDEPRKYAPWRTDTLEAIEGMRPRRATALAAFGIHTAGELDDALEATNAALAAEWGMLEDEISEIRDILDDHLAAYHGSARTVETPPTLQDAPGAIGDPGTVDPSSGHVGGPGRARKPRSKANV